VSIGSYVGRFYLCQHKRLSLTITLALIITEIMAVLYPVKLVDDGIHRRSWRTEFENRLHHWMIDLPDELLYHEAPDKPAVAPHVIILHIEYHAAVLLLHRAL
jgi:hypothetical protein